MLIRKASVQDVEEIILLILDGYDTAKLETMIASCPGYHNFLKIQIEQSDDFSEYRYFVIESNSKILGMIEYKLFKDLIFLNNINISKLGRKSGLAKFLFEGSLKILNTEQFNSISLDVFEDNQIAFNWYKKLGFAEESRTSLYRFSNSIILTSNASLVSGFGVSLYMHNYFGFSNFNIETPKDSYVVGMLNNKWFRVYSTSFVDDNELLSTLNKIDSSRDILFSVNDAEEFNLCDDFVFISRSIRMKINILDLQLSLIN